MASSGTSNVYVHVIEDVISKVRDEFINNGGPGEGVLNELQGVINYCQLWELKMMQFGAILGPIDRSAIEKSAVGGPLIPNTVHDLNVPYEGIEEYETPTTDLLFPPTPLQTPLVQTPLPRMAQTPLPGLVQTPLPSMAQTPLPRTDGSSLYDGATGSPLFIPNEFSSANSNGGVADIKAGLGRPNHFMQPPSSWLNQRPSLDVNVAYVEGREEGERRAPRQQATQDFNISSGKRKRGDFSQHYNAGGYIPQQDGAGDALLDQEIYNYQGVANEDYNIVNTPAPNEMQASTPALALNELLNEDDDDDEPLNEDDDDDLDDVDQGEDLNTTHLVLAQFDKVTRTKSRWKCTLKDGIMDINNKEILFNKATGEFDF